MATDHTIPVSKAVPDDETPEVEGHGLKNRMQDPAEGDRF